MPKRARSHLKKSSCISLARRNAYTHLSIMLQYKVLLAARQSITAYRALCGGPLCKLNVANCAQGRLVARCYWQQQAVVVRRDQWPQCSSCSLHHYCRSTPWVLSAVLWYCWRWCRQYFHTKVVLFGNIFLIGTVYTYINIDTLQHTIL